MFAFLLSLLQISFNHYGAMRVLKIHRLTITWTVSKSLAHQRANNAMRKETAIQRAIFIRNSAAWLKTYARMQRLKAITRIERIGYPTYQNGKVIDHVRVPASHQYH